VEKAPMNEDRFNMEVRKFLKEVGVTSQREIERVIRDGQVKGGVLKLRMTLTAENMAFEHVIERSITVDDDQ
jgi:16S rRNA U516 pseudouridylate synthase RsuA-like enzyme